MNKIDNQWVKCRQFMRSLCRNSFFFSLENFCVVELKHCRLVSVCLMGKITEDFSVKVHNKRLMYQLTINSPRLDSNALHAIERQQTERKTDKDRERRRKNVARIKIYVSNTRRIERRSATLYKMQSSMCDASPYQPLLLLMSPLKICSVYVSRWYYAATRTTPRINIELYVLFFLS